MTARPPVDLTAVRRALARSPLGQLAVTGGADSEQSERSTAGRSRTVPDEPRSHRHNAHQYAPMTPGGQISAPRTRSRPRRSRGRQNGAGTVELDAGSSEPEPAGGARVPAQLETYRTSFLKRDQSGTKFTIGAVPPDVETWLDHIGRLQRMNAGRDLELNDAGEILQEQLADDPRAHYYRRAVAMHLEPVWLKRAAALVSCGEAGARCDCGDCGTPHVLPYRCGARSCPTCARTASAIACEKVARKAELAQLGDGSSAPPLLEGWDGRGPAKQKAWRTLVLTTAARGTEAERYEPATLRAFVLAVRRAWGPFWRSTPWGKRVNDVTAGGGPTKRVRRDTLAAMGIEIGDGGMVHLHAAVYGEYVESEELARLWKAACPVAGFIRLRLMREQRNGPPVTSASGDALRNALREVLKYLTKGHKSGAQRPERAAAAEYALRGQRRVETCGALRLVPTVTDADVATQGKPCMACGGEPATWRWQGIRAPTYVRRNGGFGLAVIVDEMDADALSEVKRRETRALQSEARERAAAEARERRPGGRYYGGDAPPWWDDPEETVSEDVTATFRTYG